MELFAESCDLFFGLALCIVFVMNLPNVSLNPPLKPCLGLLSR
jgi:hypothetical protein